MREYYEDAIYNKAGESSVQDGQPSTREGNEGDEKWFWVNGRGLFLGKKYQGEWRFINTSTQLLEAGEIESGSFTSGGGGGTSGGVGNFTNITVSNDTSLQTSTGISGTLSVTATSLTNFPTSNNLQLTSQKLDTIQDIQTTSSVRFNELGLGTAPSGEAGNIELTSVLGVSAPTFINASLYMYNTNYTNTSGSNLTDGLGLDSLTQAEANQLKNIGSSTISSTQWGYVGALDQHLTTTSGVKFGTLSLEHGAGNGTWLFDPDVNGNLSIEPPGLADRYIRIGSSSQDDVTVKSYNYTSGLFTGDGWGISEQNNKHNLELDNLSVRGTLSVYELLIQQVRATNGSIFVTSAAKLTTEENAVKVYGSNPTTYTLVFEADGDNNKPHPFADGDLIMARRVDISGDTTDVVAEFRFTVTDASEGDSNELVATNQLSTGATLPTGQGGSTDAYNGFDFVRIGNTTNLSRQGGVYLTSDDLHSPFMDIFNEVSGWEQWDGITSAFQFSNGSFDGLTFSQSGSADWASGPGAWQHKLSSGGSVIVQSSGGLQNNSYCAMANGGQAASIRQAIDFPNISTGTYSVDITWYAKGSAGGRIALQEVSGTQFVDYFQADGTRNNATSGSAIDYITMTSITSPSAQPDLTTEWQKYQWRITVDATASVQNYSIFFKPAAGSGKTLDIDNVRISLPNKVKTRVGNIEGVGANGYGLWGENVWLTGRITANSGYIGDELQGWEISSTGIKNASSNTYISSGQSTVGLDNGGIFLGGNGTFSAGASGSNGIKWDGSALTVRGSIHIDSNGSIDNSLVPTGGRNFKLVAGGYLASTAECGVFKVASDGDIDEQVGGAPTTNTDGMTVMVWDPGTNALDTNYDSDGVKHSTTESTIVSDIEGVSNGKVVAVMVHGTAYNILNTASSSTNSSLRSAIQKIGGTLAVMDNTTAYGAYMCIGIKKSAAHSGGTEFSSTIGNQDTLGKISLTINLKDNVINILDHEGPLVDFDATGEKSFKYNNQVGFQMQNNDYNSSYYRPFLNFAMPHINPEDASNVYLFFTSRNLTDGGNTDVRLYLNGSHLSSLSTTDLQDANGTQMFVHEFHNIPSQLFKTDVGEINAFQWMMDANNNSATMDIYDFELRDSTTGQIYSSGAIAGPEGNMFANPGFENDTAGTQNSVDTWSQTVTSGNTFEIVDNNQMTGMQSLRVSMGSVASSSHLSQNVSMKAGKTYVLRWKTMWEDAFTVSESPTISIHSPDFDAQGTDAGIDLAATHPYTVSWQTSKQWVRWTEINPNITEANMVGNWVTMEWKFTTPNSIGASGWNDNQADTWKVWFYFGSQNNQKIWLDHCQFFEIEASTPEKTGLFMTGDRMGFYNGTGGFNGWSSLIKDDGTFFFGSPYTAANLITPSSGGPYVRFTGDTLEVNANMVAGLIQSENWGASAGTKINLADGTINTGGTSSPKFQLASDGTVNLNGAALTGGTITGQLFQSNYAEGAVTFVTKKETGITAVNGFTVNVNGVERLICARIAESAEMNFGEADDLNSSGETKSLGIYGYDYQSVNTLNRTADTLANTNVTFTGGAPFYICTAATNDGNGDNDELVRFTFRIGSVEETFYAYSKTRIRPTTPNRGYVKVKGKVGAGTYTDVISADSSNDFYKAGTATWTMPSGLNIYCFATSDYQDAGDIIDMKSQWYISGTTDQMYSASTGLEIFVDQEGEGSHVQTSTINFGPRVWKVYN